MTDSATEESTLARPAEKIARGLGGLSVRVGLLIGLIAGSAAVVSIASVPGVVGFLGAGLALLMVTIAVIDWRSFLIPNQLTGAGFCLAMANAAIATPDMVVEACAVAAMRGVMLALVFFIIRQIYARIRGRPGLGLGDVKLAAVAGAWLDWQVMPIAINVAAFTALSVYVIRQLAIGQPLSATGRLPFGLFLAPAIWGCWLLEATLLTP